MNDVRELENMMQRTALLTKRTIVTEFYHKQELLRVNETIERLKGITENEKNHIIAMLKRCKWKVYGPGGAVELLQMSVSILNSRKKIGY